MLIDNNPPPVNADTHDHGARLPSTKTAARVHTPIASTASANDDPLATAPSSAPSSARAHPQKCAATSSARERNRASQSLTVSAGLSISSATRRYPAPVAASTAAPITSTASQRRATHTSGNNTCVAPHATSRQRPRRGRNHRTPSNVRTGRRRAHPQPPRTPRPHRGHVSRPATISASKPARSSATISKIAPPSGNQRAPSPHPPRIDEGAQRQHDDHHHVVGHPPEKIHHHPACR